MCVCARVTRVCVCVCARARLCLSRRGGLTAHGRGRRQAAVTLLLRFALLAGRKVRKLDQRPHARSLVCGLPLAFWTSTGGWPFAHSAFHRLLSGRADLVWRTGCDLWRGTRTWTCVCVSHSTNSGQQFEVSPPISASVRLSFAC